jgi:hypothetical protein
MQPERHLLGFWRWVGSVRTLMKSEKSKSWQGLQLWAQKSITTLPLTPAAPAPHLQ